MPSNAPHESVLLMLENAGLLDHLSSCGVHHEGFWGRTRPGFVARVEEHARIGLATEMPIQPHLHPEMCPGRDFRYSKGTWGEPWCLQVIVFDGGAQWYADGDAHAPVDVAGAIGHGIDVIKDRLRGNA